jgi:phosphoserine phosphatase RsbU/P
MTDHALTILVVEDSPSDADLLMRALRGGFKDPFECILAATLDEAFSCLLNNTIGLVITDLNLPDSAGLITFQRLKDRADGIPIVILSGLEDVKLATESVRMGAQDYVVKGATDDDTLGRIVRFAIERSRRILAERERDQATRELELAREIQQSFLPSRSLALPGFDIAGAAHSVDRACGDYYDFFPSPNDRFCIALGDVCGHGMPAALTMLQVRACLRLLTKQGAEPGAVMSGLNEGIMHDNEDRRRFVSLFYAQLEPQSRTLAFASAGQPGYLLRSDGSTQNLQATGMVLGIVPGVAPPDVETLALETGDLLFIPTDGFHEAMDGNRQLFGESRMLEIIRNSADQSAAEIIRTLSTAVTEYAGESPQHDDMTAIIAKVT